MSYLVLARKYRPKNFSEMVGQEHVVQALSNALTQQRLHHAYLFTGTRGVGKTTVSRILAKSLNCQGVDGTGGITATPCGVCQACTDIDSGRFVDYTELDAASNRGVDEVQSLLEQAVYKPVQGRFKVFMIDEVHMLTNTAFNAMLKTLEEPPEYLKFVLATTDPQKVPVTVLSRCLQFNLRPMAPETVLEHLVHVLKAEGVTADESALRLLARAARGSMRDALSLTDQAIAFGSGQLLEAPVRQMLGAVDRSYVFRLIEALALGDGKTVVETSETLRRNGLSPASTLEEMTQVLQRMAVCQAVPQAAGSDAVDPDAADIARLAALMPADETQLLYSLCLHGRGELGLAPDEYAALTMVLLRLLAFKPGSALANHSSTAPTALAEKKTLKLGPEAVIGQGESLTETPLEPAQVAPAIAPPPVAPVPLSRPSQAAGAEAEPIPAPTPAPSVSLTATAARPGNPASGQVPMQSLPVVNSMPDRPLRQADQASDASKIIAVPVRQAPAASARSEPMKPEAAASVQPPVTTPEGDFWFETVQAMMAAESITALVRELALQSQLIGRDTGHWLLRMERESLNQPAARERLQTALAGQGHAVALGVEIGRVSDSPAKRIAYAQAEKQLQAENLIFNDPFVQSMMRDFGAKIVPGSIKPAV